MTRRQARVLVLAAFAAAFAGPWGSDHETYRISFPNVIRETFDASPTWWAVVVGATVLVPLACLVAVLSSIRPAHILYRVVLSVPGIPFLVLLVILLLATHGPLAPSESWGVLAYAGALVLAFVVEMLPARGAPERDYSEVFR